MFFGIPIAVSLIASTMIYLGFMTDIALTVLPQRLFTTVDSFPLMAVPFFILSGTLMQEGGISDRLVKFVSTLIGHFHGGLTIVVIISSAFFAAISGSSSATIAAIGVILIPAMIKHGYGRNFSAAVQCCSGQLGIIIPPSIPMVLYGVATETSIDKLFRAGILPGLFMALSLIVVAYIISRKRGYSGVAKSSRKEQWIAFREAILAILMPVIVLGGIYGGIFTPTEAAAIAVAYSFIVGTFVYKQLNFKKIYLVLVRSAVTTGVLMFLIAGAGVFAWMMARLNITTSAALFFSSISQNKYVFLLLINFMLLVVGMFLDAGPAIMILAPLLAPIAASYGIDLVHFGIIMVVNLAVGLATPPVGVNIFLSCQIANIKIEDIIKELFPFLAVLFFVILVVTYFPILSLAFI